MSYDDWKKEEYEIDKAKKESLGWYRSQIKGLLLILDSEDNPFISVEYMQEKLKMILDHGIGFHPHVKDALNQRRRHTDDA